MSLNSLLPKIFNCPECDSRLKEVVYGLLAGPPADNEVAGGCEWSDDAPTKLCPLCGWEGALGGRSWSTGITETRIAPHESDSDGAVTVEVVVDLRNITNDELFELGKTHLPARFELVHRGFEAQAIDDYYDGLEIGDAHSWPLIRKDACFIFYNTESQLVEQVCTFSAQRTMHEFQYLRTGFEEWEFAETLSDFHEVVFGKKNPSLQVWEIDLDHNHEAEDDESEAFHYGSKAIKAMLAEERITEDELSREGDQYERPIYWPHWFDAGMMINFVANPFAPH